MMSVNSTIEEAGVAISYMRCVVAFAVICACSAHAQEVFPRFTFYEDHRGDLSRQAEISDFLVPLEEDSIQSLLEPDLTYRLIYMAPYETGPFLLIRVSVDAGCVRVKTGSYPRSDPELTPTIQTFMVANEQWLKVASAIRDSSFWESMTNEPVPEDVLVIDASMWIIEGNMNGRYKIVQRRSPDSPRDASFLDVVRELLQLGNPGLAGISSRELIEDVD